MDSNVFYDPEVIGAWKLNLPADISMLTDMRPLPKSYKSNWRVLHVDGFEQKTIQFFRYAPLPERGGRANGTEILMGEPVCGVTLMAGVTCGGCPLCRRPIS